MSDFPEPSDGCPNAWSAEGVAQSVQSLSGLTSEEFASLIGVSTRKEVRLREVADALHRMLQPTVTDTRNVLFRKAPGGLSPYDLLRQGSIDAAIDLATGITAGSRAYSGRENEPLSVQLARDQGSLPDTSSVLNRHMSFVFKR